MAEEQDNLPSESSKLDWLVVNLRWLWLFLIAIFISNQIIEQHGGSIKVDSALGEGSHFVVKMPKVVPETVKSSQNEPTAAEPNLTVME